MEREEEEMRWQRSYRATLVASLIVLMAGCAGPNGSLSPDGSGLPADPGRSLVGVWVGTVSGTEIQTGSGLVTIPATLTVKDDQTWTLTAGSLRVASRSTTIRGNRLVLEGETAAEGRPVTMTLAPPRGGALYGAINIYYAGRPVSAGINLRAVPQAP
jgi:hypothetical protein